MFAVISKRDYWDALNAGVMKPQKARLKDIQDAYILHRLKGVAGARILEMGGGVSRILPVLTRENNECWNVDKLEGLGFGPATASRDSDVRVVTEYVGSYST